MRIELQPAYVLHARPYRDTSLLVDFFTPAAGRVSAVARGVRQRKSRSRSLLNPFTRLLISLQGKTDLKLLTAVEADHQVYALHGEQLFSGFYLNELLLRLLPEQDAHDALFEAYEFGLRSLQAQAPIEPVLRCFELTCLTELGYGVDFYCDARTGEPLRHGDDYTFVPQQGFISRSVSDTSPAFSGALIHQLAERDFSGEGSRQAAKYLCRLMLAPLLGSRPLKSRELFINTGIAKDDD